MTQKDEKAKTDRRSFLKLAGAGAVGGAAALVSAADEADASNSDASGDRLYRETDHVKSYYRLARF